jgi:hypothetical protein
MAIENRGNKITSQSQSNAAWSMVADKWEKIADQRFDTNPGGPRAGGGDRGPGKKNSAKQDKLKKIAGVGRKKINTNPVPKTTIKTSSPTSDAVREWSADNRARERHYGLKEGSTKSIIKVNSNPVPSKTRIGNLAGSGLRGGIGGGGMNWQNK